MTDRTLYKALFFSVIPYLYLYVSHTNIHENTFLFTNKDLLLLNRITASAIEFSQHPLGDA